MTIDFVENELLERIENILKDKKLKNSDGIFVGISCFTGWLPPKNDENEDYPFAMLRVLEGSDKIDESSATFKVFIGSCAYKKNTKATFEEYKEGHKNLLSVIQNIRKGLLSKKNLGYSRVVFPFSYKIYEEQNFPFIHAEITITVELSQVEEIF